MIRIKPVTARPTLECTVMFAGNILTFRMSCAIGQMKAKALKNFFPSFLMQPLLELRKWCMTHLSS